jgi:hypothetical protein
MNEHQLLYRKCSTQFPHPPQAEKSDFSGQKQFCASGEMAGRRMIRATLGGNGKERADKNGILAGDAASFCHPSFCLYSFCSDCR